MVRTVPSPPTAAEPNSTGLTSGASTDSPPVPCQRGAEGDVVGVDRDQRFVVGDLPGIEIDLEPAALARRQPAAVPAVVVADPEVVGVFAFGCRPSRSECPGFAAVGHLQAFAAAFVDPLDAEVEAGGAEGELRRDRGAVERDGRLRAFLQAHGEGRRLGAGAAGSEPRSRRCSAGADFDPAAVAAAELEVARVGAFDVGGVDRAAGVADVFDGRPRPEFDSSPTVVFSKVTGEGERLSSGPAAAALEASAEEDEGEWQQGGGPDLAHGETSTAVAAPHALWIESFIQSGTTCPAQCSESSRSFCASV